MAAWPEVVNAKNENRYELILCGNHVSQRLQKYGFDKDLFSCTSINFLNISNTCLSTIPPEINLLHNLTSLVLHSNQLTELCAQICDLKKLKMLDASNNKIKEIPKEISKLESLVTLNLSANCIEHIPDMANNKWLTSVDLSRNSLCDFSQLCQKQLVHLAEIRLKGNKINNIPSTINQLTGLKMLDVSDNEIPIVTGEISVLQKLKELSLEGNPLSDKRLAKMVVQCKSKQILDYIKDHGIRECNEESGQKNKKGKKGKGKNSISESENEVGSVSKYKVIVQKSSDVTWKIERTELVENVRGHILACIVRDVVLDVELMKKFIQLQSKLHDGVCEKRNFATIATHDLDLCKGSQFIYTALPPETLKIIPLGKNKECTGRELFSQLRSEAESLRKEKKRNTYSGIHKFLHLIEGKELYPCLLNCESTVISFPPLTNSEVTKISTNTKNILIEVTSSGSQGNCKKVLDTSLREMLLNGIGASVDESGTSTMIVEQVRVEDTCGKLIAVYPSKIDLDFADNIIHVVRN